MSFFSEVVKIHTWMLVGVDIGLFVTGVWAGTSIQKILDRLTIPR